LNAPLPQRAAINCVKLDETARELTGPLRTLKRKLAIRRRLASLGLIERHEVFRAVTACATSDLVIWNPAGEIHPTGDSNQVLQLLLLMRIAQLEGKKTAVINHSLEIVDDRLRRLITHVYANLDYVGVRDAKSVEAALALGLARERIYEAPDLVFLASRQAGKETIDTVSKGSIALAINGLEAPSGLEEWNGLMNGLKKFGRPFLFVSNAVNHDLEFARRLAEKFGGIVVEHQPGYQALRGYYRNCDSLISSRLHASILALCEGVPVVSIEPSVFKLTAIFQQLNYPIGTERLQERGWSDRVLAKVTRCLSEQAAFASEGLKSLERQTGRIDAAYAPLFALARQ
jgi:polysaccharide pyruvyl transferase WcaK-like protein